MVQTTSPIDTMICGRCGHRKPISEFRRRRRDSELRHQECKSCFNEYMRQRAAARRSKKFVNFARDLSNPRVAVSRVPALSGAMVEQFGGLDNLCSAWVDHIQAAAARRPGSRMVLQSLQAIVRLVELAEAERKKAAKDQRPDVRNLSDEELQREVQELLSEAKEAAPQ